MDFRDAIAQGDRRAQLVALRDRLAEEIETCHARELAPLAARLRDVIADLDSMTVPEASKTDELRKRRERRQAKASGRAAGDE